MSKKLFSSNTEMPPIVYGEIYEFVGDICGNWKDANLKSHNIVANT